MIKIKTGYREDEYYVIKNSEAHKAYYLFEHPEARTVFSNGVALRGEDIRGIEPAWNEMMGWNPTHKLDNDDWNEINKSGIKEKINEVIDEAQKIAKLAEKNMELLNLKLSEAKQLLLK
jgi:hypothetical protein